MRHSMRLAQQSLNPRLGLHHRRRDPRKPLLRSVAETKTKLLAEDGCRVIEPKLQRNYCACALTQAHAHTQSRARARTCASTHTHTHTLVHTIIDTHTQAHSQSHSQSQSRARVPCACALFFSSRRCRPDSRPPATPLAPGRGVVKQLIN